MAGAIYVPQWGIIRESDFTPAMSIEGVIWVAVGGHGTLWGAILGAILVNWGKSYFTGALPEAWLYMLGGLFVFSTLVLPKVSVGTVPILFNTPKRKLGAVQAAPLNEGGV